MLISNYNCTILSYGSQYQCMSLQRQNTMASVKKLMKYDTQFKLKVVEFIQENEQLCRSKRKRNNWENGTILADVWRQIETDAGEEMC